MRRLLGAKKCPTSEGHQIAAMYDVEMEQDDPSARRIRVEDDLRSIY